MAKTKTAWFCKECGAESPKYLGRCTACGTWNSLVEQTMVVGKKTSGIQDSVANLPIPVGELNSDESPRLDLRSVELNRVLGGGLVTGSLVLLGGEPGIGKSTLALQLSLRLKGTSILYVSGEESYRQLKLRADRIGITNQDCLLYCETDLETILHQAGQINPRLVVIDSIQTVLSADVESSPGSVSQIRECTGKILQFAKKNNIPFLIIGHITKEGSIAGPKILEHMVDTVLQFEGDQNYVYRIVRAIKNRFGSTSEIGIFEMQQSGLREVSNPSELLLTQRENEISGIAVAATMEGNRPILIETQALVSSAAYGTPQRSAIGFDVRRLNMLLAVLEKRVGFKLAFKDVFLNLAGGIKADDPALDLSVISAILSSDLNLTIPQGVCFAAEIGLTGEIRPVGRIEQRIAEAQKLGFTAIYLSKYNQKGLDPKRFTIQMRFVTRVEEVFQSLFR
ncbi:MAG: DNA repair protein RadA [Bacteroidales bacterium]|nr:DNA repair protein RadA [Bacteroidales bacterium]